jgi:hypothetical protein
VAPPVQVAQADPNSVTDDPNSDWADSLGHSCAPNPNGTAPDCGVRSGHGNGFWPNTQTDCFVGMVDRSDPAIELHCMRKPPTG